jgi:hypothetical protein
VRVFRSAVRVRAGVVLAAATLAGCSSSGTSGTGSPAQSAPVSGSAAQSGPGGDPIAARKHPCALFTADQLRSALGVDVQAGKPEQGALTPTCQWLASAAGPTVVAAVRKASESSYDSDLRGPVAHDFQRTSPVVAEDSVWFGSAADQKTSVSLLVLSGGYQYQMTVGNYSSAGDETTVRAKLLALAGSEF